MKKKFARFICFLVDVAELVAITTVNLLALTSFLIVVGVTGYSFFRFSYVEWVLFVKAMVCITGGACVWVVIKELYYWAERNS